MPPLPKLRLAALAELERQLRYAPGARLLANVERIEALASDVEPSMRYPEEWIEFRVTGLRRDLPPSDPVAGADLLADLSSLAERLSERARLTEAELRAREREAGRAPPLHADALASRWNVSRKTVDRYRKRGLIGRRVRSDRGRTVLMFTAGALEAFEAAQRDRLERAARFDRIDPATEVRLLRRAARYHERFGCTLNRAAARLADRFGRSHEGVRQVLRRHDASSPAPIFTGERTLSARRRRAIERAERRGVEPTALARRLGRPRASVVRVIHVERGRVLRRLAEAGALDGPDPPGALPERPPPPAPAPATMGGLVALMRARRELPGVVEREWLSAMHGWRRLAGERIGGLDHAQPEATALDEAETCLRRAAHAHAALTRAHLALLLGTIERRLDAPIERLRTDRAGAAIFAAIAAAGRVVASFDPKRGGRLAAPIGLAADRAVAAVLAGSAPETGPAHRAGPALRSDAEACDWRSPPPAWSAAIPADRRLIARPETDDPVDTGRPNWWPTLDATDRRVLAWRFGQPADPDAGEADKAGAWAMTLDELAERIGTGRAQAPGRVRAAVRAALAASRDAGRPESRPPGAGA